MEYIRLMKARDHLEKAYIEVLDFLNDTDEDFPVEDYEHIENIGVNIADAIDDMLPYSDESD